MLVSSSVWVMQGLSEYGLDAYLQTCICYLLWLEVGLRTSCQNAADTSLIGKLQSKALPSQSLPHRFASDIDVKDFIHVPHLQVGFTSLYGEQEREVTKGGRITDHPNALCSALCYSVTLCQLNNS